MREQEREEGGGGREEDREIDVHSGEAGESERMR